MDESGEQQPVTDEAAEYRRGVLRRELARMAEKEQNSKLTKKMQVQEVMKKEKEKLKKERQQKGFYILPGAEESKRSIQKDVELEKRLALSDRQAVLAQQTTCMQGEIAGKFGLVDLPKGKELLSLAETFYRNERMPNQHLPEHITRELTSEEINDFRIVFEMFDVKSKGYITSDDLRRAAKMLGLTAKKRIFKEMIEDVTKDKRGKVTFVMFLELVINIQGDGPDCFQEIEKGFTLLDRGNKGYLTTSDIRVAADELSIPLSTTAISDMIIEADKSGDKRISFSEFKEIMGQTGRFHSVMLGSGDAKVDSIH